MINNRLTSCCHIPYLADGICANCGQPCVPFVHAEEDFIQRGAREFFGKEIIEPVHTVIKPLEDKPKIPRWKDENEEYDWHAQNDLTTS